MPTGKGAARVLAFVIVIGIYVIENEAVNLAVVATCTEQRPADPFPQLGYVDRPVGRRCWNVDRQTRARCA